MRDDNDLPILNSVIKPGNESIIESTRLGREVLERLEAMKTTDAPSSPSVGTASTPEPAAEACAVNENEACTAFGSGLAVQLRAEADQPLRAVTVETQSLPTSATFDGTGGDDTESIELLIDELVDKHVAALRADLRQLLLHAEKS